MEVAEINRFLDVAVDAQAVALDHVALLAGRGHDHDGNGAGAGIVFDFFEHFQAADFGKFEVEKHDFGRVVEVALGILAPAKEKVQGFFAVPDDEDFVGQIIFAEGQQGEFDVVGIVFDQQDFDFGVRHKLEKAKG